VVLVDVVIVSYNSRATLRACVEPLAGEDWIQVIVADNASADGSLAAIADLPLTALGLARNFGFAYACNRGAEAGSAPSILFLNPDGRIEPDALRRLLAVLDGSDTVAAAAPRIRSSDGELELSLRRFPRLRSTYGQALFLHRLLPHASWADEVVRDPSRYERPGAPDWASGACLLVRRSAFEQVGGWDESFFLYGEDVDLCWRFSRAGQRVVFDPAATATHVGGASAPRASLLPQLVRGRIQAVSKQEPRAIVLLHRLGLALGALTHAALTTQGGPARRGQLQAFMTALRTPSSAAPGPVDEGLSLREPDRNETTATT
jgi:GT2 family glycosyltransferase